MGEKHEGRRIYAAPEPFEGVVVDIDRLFANVLALDGI